ncbi:MAG: hypothetical protein KDC87_20040 [Planctomycetes bacterium]|nr:hypothetical protein [Planctomycetota bacterium]MCB9888531.1 hypothetical protein [Planctomycetota bacterium]
MRANWAMDSAMVAARKAPEVRAEQRAIDAELARLRGVAEHGRSIDGTRLSAALRLGYDRDQRVLSRRLRALDDLRRKAAMRQLGDRQLVLVQHHLPLYREAAVAELRARRKARP